MMSYTTLIFLSLLMPSIILLGTCLLMVATDTQTNETIYCVIGGSGGIIISFLFGHMYREIICPKQRVETNITYVQTVDIIPITDVIEETDVIEIKYDDNIEIPIANLV